MYGDDVAVKAVSVTVVVYNIDKFVLLVDVSVYADAELLPYTSKRAVKFTALLFVKLI